MTLVKAAFMTYFEEVNGREEKQLESAKPTRRVTPIKLEEEEETTQGKGCDKKSS